jgi:putative phosphoribosyl transferase
MSAAKASHTDRLEDRPEAGRRLAERLEKYRDDHPIVLGIPRGGVPVAYEVAARLGAPLDVLVIRKVGAPADPEYGLGAVGEGGIRLLDRTRIRDAGYTVEGLEPYVRSELAEVERRLREYRGGARRLPLEGRTVILVDDGVATGGTAETAVRYVRAASARKVVLALGVCPRDTFRRLRPEVDDLVVLVVPESFYAVGEFYRNFDPVPDEEVRRLLGTARSEAGPLGSPSASIRRSGTL